MTIAIIAFTALILFVFLSFGARAIKVRAATDNNAKLYAEVIERLVKQRENGEITDQEYEVLDAEAKAQLIASVANDEAEVTATIPWLRWLPLLGVPALAVALYLSQGSNAEVEIRNMMSKVANEPTQESLASLDADIQRVLESNPDKHAYRVVRAQLLQRMGDAKGAASQYEKLTQVYPQDTSLLLDYAQLQFQAAKGELTGEMVDTYKRVVMLEPDNLSALSMLGMISMQLREYDDAVEYWQKAVELLKEGDERDLIVAGLARARELASEMPKAEVLSLEVTLTGAPEKLEQYLFVYAVLKEGMRAPLAIKRFTPGDVIPSQITLTERDAMMPSHKLAEGQQIRVIARLSDTPNVMNQDNDSVVEVDAVLDSLNTQAELLLSSQ